MSSTARAVQRLLRASTEAELQKVLLEEPSLLTPEADSLLAGYERDAGKAGDKDSAAMLAEMREFLRTLQKAAAYEPPDMPGSIVAFELIHALVATPQAAVPRLALDPVFSTTLKSMYEYADQAKLQDLADNLGTVDQRIAAAGGLPSKPAHDGQASIYATIASWIDAPSWLDSHTVLIEHPELQAADVTAIIDLLANGARLEGDNETAQVYEQHVSILKLARKGKLEEAYMALLLGERSERVKRGQ